MKRFLLDTNILLGLAREAEWARRVYLRFNLDDSDVIVFTSAAWSAVNMGRTTSG
ncbi:MAG: hypothetical protein OXE96_03870 [Gemmatimonadetes bacterium]|nr:hypothetical protein [Gemmatimonadota bacterium]